MRGSDSNNRPRDGPYCDTCITARPKHSMSSLRGCLESASLVAL